MKWRINQCEVMEVMNDFSTQAKKKNDMERTNNKNGFVMLTAIIILMLIAWPLQRLLSQHQFVLKQQVYREEQLQNNLQAQQLL